MKDYDKNKESSYLKYWDVDNLYQWAISQKLPVNGIKYLSEFDEGYFLEVDIQFPEELSERRNDLPFLPDRVKFEKLEKLVANVHDKNEYLIH